MAGFQYLGNQFGYANALSVLAIVSWLPIVLVMFNIMPARKAVMIGFIAGWLFLPEIFRPLPGLPDYGKFTVTSYSVLLATVLFNSDRLDKFRLDSIDLPMVVWCLCPFITSITNGLGVKDGVSGILGNIAEWGLPYFIGRLYFTDLKSVRQLAYGFIIGGLAYVPLCLFEVRMSPQLHRIFYGAHAHSSFAQSIRYDGFRPTVFLRHGLAVGAWMMAAALVALWLWRSGTLKKIKFIPAAVVVGMLVVTLVLVKSTGAYGLFVIGILVLYASVLVGSNFFVIVLIAAIAFYLYVNAATESYFSDQLIEFLQNSGLFSPDRLQSLEFRFNNEEVLVDHARDRAIWGWGGWNRARVVNPAMGDGKLAIQDSLWILIFGENGAVGLISVFSVILLPAFGCLLRIPARLWNHKDFAAPVALSVVLLLYGIDSLLNALLNPLYVFVGGAIANLAIQPMAVLKAQQKQMSGRKPLRRQKNHKGKIAPQTVQSERQLLANRK